MIAIFPDTNPKAEAVLIRLLPQAPGWHKLEWYRLGNEISDRQWRDILSALKVQAERLDLVYLHKWAQELNVADLPQRALKESE